MGMLCHEELIQIFTNVDDLRELKEHLNENLKRKLKDDEIEMKRVSQVKKCFEETFSLWEKCNGEIEDSNSFPNIIELIENEDLNSEESKNILKNTQLEQV